MNLIKRIYSIYVGLCFVLPFLLLFPFFFATTIVSKLKRFFQVPYRIWHKVFFTISGISINKTGKILNDKKLRIYICNHQSYADIPILTATIPGDFVYVGMKELEKVPLFGYIFKKQHISVDRRNAADRLAVLKKAQVHIKEGRSICIFPEGKINTTAAPLLPFQSGAFAIAKAANIPITPIVIFNSAAVLPDNNSWLIGEKRVYLKILDSINADGKEINELLYRCNELMKGELEKYKTKA